jgi:hypothetical protein
MNKWGTRILAATLTLTSASQLALADGKGTPYSVTGQYYETCACAVSCPCATNEFLPTEGHCDAVMMFHMDKASVGKVKLDGVNFGVVLKSPKNQKVMEAFTKGEMDHFAVYLDEKMTPEQRQVIPGLMGALFGPMEVKGAKAPAFVPINLTATEDGAKLDAAGGKLTFDIVNIKIGETKHGGKTEAKHIKMDGVVPFPWVGPVAQGKSNSFHYVDGTTKWDYKNRNAYLGPFTNKGTIAPAAAEKPAAK